MGVLIVFADSVRVGCLSRAVGAGHARDINNSSANVGVPLGALPARRARRKTSTLYVDNKIDFSVINDADSLCNRLRMKGLAVRFALVRV